MAGDGHTEMKSEMQMNRKETMVVMRKLQTLSTSSYGRECQGQLGVQEVHHRLKSCTSLWRKVAET